MSIYIWVCREVINSNHFWSLWPCTPWAFRGPWSTPRGQKHHQGTSSSQDLSPCCVGAQQRRWQGIQWPKWWGGCPMALGCPSRWLGLLERQPTLEPAPNSPTPRPPVLELRAAGKNIWKSQTSIRRQTNAFVKTPFEGKSIRAVKST